MTGKEYGVRDVCLVPGRKNEPKIQGTEEKVDQNIFGDKTGKEATGPLFRPDFGIDQTGSMERFYTGSGGTDVFRGGTLGAPPCVA